MLSLAVFVSSFAEVVRRSQWADSLGEKLILKERRQPEQWLADFLAEREDRAGDHEMSMPPSSEDSEMSESQNDKKSNQSVTRSSNRSERTVSESSKRSETSVSQTSKESETSTSYRSKSFTGWLL